MQEYPRGFGFWSPIGRIAPANRPISQALTSPHRRSSRGGSWGPLPKSLRTVSISLDRLEITFGRTAADELLPLGDAVAVGVDDHRRSGLSHRRMVEKGLPGGKGTIRGALPAEVGDDQVVALEGELVDGLARGVGAGWSAAAPCGCLVLLRPTGPLEGLSRKAARGSMAPLWPACGA